MERPGLAVEDDSIALGGPDVTRPGGLRVEVSDVERCDP
jgi:hypothetical protein